MKEDNRIEQDRISPRRRLLKALTGTGGIMATGVMLPKTWVSPVVDSIMLPSHAQTSGPIVGNFGAAASTMTRRDDGPSVLDLVAPNAYALQPAIAKVGNVYFEAFWTVRENDALICGSAHTLSPNASADLSGSVPRTGDSLGNFQRSVGPETLQFKNQRVEGGGVSLTAGASGESGAFFAPPGPGCLKNVTSSINSSSPYGDDEDIA
jgi:hypothetical protein